MAPAMQLYQLSKSKVKLDSKPGFRTVFFFLDLHIYWGTFYGGNGKKRRSFKKGGLYICSVASFLRAKGRELFRGFGTNRGTFGDALCIKMLDRKVYSDAGTHVA